MRFILLLSFLLIVSCAVPRPFYQPTKLIVQTDTKQIRHIEFEAPTGVETNFLSGGIKLKALTIESAGKINTKEAQAFYENIKSTLDEAFPRTNTNRKAIELSIHYIVDFKRGANVTDVISVFSFGLFPLGVHGEYTLAKLHFDLFDPNRKIDSQQEIYRTREFSVVLFPFYRTKPIEDSFHQLHKQSFAQLIDRIRYWSTDYRRPKRNNLNRIQYTTHDPRKGRISYYFDDEKLIGIDADTKTFHVIGDDTLYQIAAQKKPSFPSLWSNYFSALSGLEVGYFGGMAQVRSEAFNPNTQEKYTIASGKARSKGYKISFYTPPQHSGFFLYPTLGFFSLDIDIEDMAGDVHLASVEGAKDIEAIGRDPQTGEEIDLGASNIYSLKLRSGYMGQRIGGNFVFGNADTQFFFTAQFGINLVEYRYTHVRLGIYHESDYEFKFAHSFSENFVLGFVYRPWHLMARCEANVEFYRDFGFPRAIPFEGPEEYDPKTQSYQRPEVKVESANALLINGFCGIGVFY